MNKPLPVNATCPMHLFEADELLHALPGAAHAPDAATAAGLAAAGQRARSTGGGATLAPLGRQAAARLACVFNVDVRAATAPEIGALRLRARDLQTLADFNLVAHRIAESALMPVLVERDFPLETGRAATVRMPDDAAALAYLGAPDDEIECPTPAQRIVFGPARRRIPALWNTESPLSALTDADPAWSAGQEPFFAGHAEALADEAFDRFFEHSGRRYQRVTPFHAEDAELLLVASGKAAAAARAVVRRMRESGRPARARLKLGLLEVVMTRPFPARDVADYARRCRAMAVLQPLDGAGPDLAGPVAAALYGAVSIPPRKRSLRQRVPATPLLHTLSYAGADGEPRAQAVFEAIHQLEAEGHARQLTLGAAFARGPARNASEEVFQGEVLEAYPGVSARAVMPDTTEDLLPKGGFCAALCCDEDTGFATAWMLADVAGLEVASGAGASYQLAAAPEADALDPLFAPPRVTVMDAPTLGRGVPPDLPQGSAVLVCFAQEDAWNGIPAAMRRHLLEENARVFASPWLKTDSGLDALCHRHGAFVKTLSTLEPVRGAASRFSEALRTHLEARYGIEDDAVLDAAVAAFREGYDSIAEIAEKPAPAGDAPARQGASLPRALKALEKTGVPVADVHRYWPLAGAQRAPLASPVTALGWAPAGVGRFQGKAQRSEVAWDPVKCTGCGKCWLLGPGGGLAPKAVRIADLFETVIQLLESGGHTIEHLRGAVRTLEPALRKCLDEAGETADFSACLEAALKEAGGEDTALARELDWLGEALAVAPFAVTAPFFQVSGLLLFLTPHPEACGAGVDYPPVCPHDALGAEAGSEESAERADKAWRLWLALPGSPREACTPKADESEPGAFARMLLDQETYLATAARDADPAVRMFLAAVCHRMAPRVRAHVARLEKVAADFETHMRLRLSETVNLDDAKALHAALDTAGDAPLSLGALSEALEEGAARKGLDAQWLRWAAGVLDVLRRTLRAYASPEAAPLGMAGSANMDHGPRNLFPFPWAPLPAGADAQFATGLFEGHMARMAEGFRATRMAELELAGRYEPARHDAFFRRFSWRDFCGDELAVCPPLVVTGADALDMGGAHGLLRSGRPLRVLLVQRAPAPRKGLALALSEAGAFVLQSSISNPGHFADGVAAGLEVRGPALFQVYSPESGAGLAELAVAARACPLYRFNGALGSTPDACLDLSGNPEGADPPVFAEYALADPAWAAHGTVLPEDADPDRCLSVEEYLELEDEEERAEYWACIEQANADGGAARIALSDALVRAGETARQTWELLLALAAQPSKVAASATAAEAQSPAEPAPEPAPEEQPEAQPVSVAPAAEAPEPAAAAPEAAEDGCVAPWIDSAKCTTCEECVKINPDMFAYDAHRKAYIKNADAGPYKHLIRAAEKCTEKIIHPGYPPASRREEKGIDKLMRRAEKFMPFGPPEPGETVAAPAPAEPEPAQSVDEAPAPPPQPEPQPPAVEAPAPRTETTPASGLDAGGDAVPDEYVAPWIDSPKCTTCEECVKINPDMFVYDEHRKAHIRDPKAGPYKHLVRAAEKCTEKIIHPGYPAPGERNEKGMDKLIRRARKFMQ